MNDLVILGTPINGNQMQAFRLKMDEMEPVTIDPLEVGPFKMNLELEDKSGMHTFEMKIWMGNGTCTAIMKAIPIVASVKSGENFAGPYTQIQEYSEDGEECITPLFAENMGAKAIGIRMENNKPMGFLVFDEACQKISGIPFYNYYANFKTCAGENVFKGSPLHGVIQWLVGRVTPHVTWESRKLRWTLDGKTWKNNLDGFKPDGETWWPHNMNLNAKPIADITP